VGHPIIDKIVKEGVQSVNISMLSKDLRYKLMTEAGQTLMHQNRFSEAAHAFALAENKEMLKEQGRWFLKQQKVGLAAHFLIHIEDEETLRDLAQRCIASNEVAAARAIYQALGDETMLAFIRENLTS
jgi:hypothetical protein